MFVFILRSPGRPQLLGRQLEGTGERPGEWGEGPQLRQRGLGAGMCSVLRPVFRAPRDKGVSSAAYTVAAGKRCRRNGF